MTPSLVPRTALFQGVVSGVSLVSGYGIGSALSAGIRKVRSGEPSAHLKRIAWWVLLGSTVVVAPLALWWGTEWQQDLRRLMSMEQLRAYEWGLILVLAVVVAAIVLIVSRVIRGGARALIRQLDKFLARRVAVIGGFTLAVAIVAGLFQGVLFDGMVSAVNQSYSVIDKGTSTWISQPQSELRSGGPGSVIDWDSLGVKGRDFAGEGGSPTVEEIAEFTGGRATEPIRVYAGLKSADSLEERVELALTDLENMGAFDRSVIAVMTTTGTGWVDENVADSFEFLHAGDTAAVAMQYSYLPSWVSFLVDRSKAADAGRELIGAVSARIDEMPEGARPKLLVFGESLGSYGTESAFEDLEDLRARTHGAMLVGPTFTNPIHGDLTDGRDEGSPSWRPIIEDGREVRFYVQPGDEQNPELTGGAEWEKPRVIYLQNSSDPITYFNPELLWKPPSWLDDPRGPDVSGDMVWVPVVTFWQVAADMAFSMGVPAGHGHRYGSNVVDGWVALATPEGWTAGDTEALRQLTDQRAEERDKRKEAAG